jgi:hypothetical protein
VVVLARIDLFPAGVIVAASRHFFLALTYYEIRYNSKYLYFTILNNGALVQLAICGRLPHYGMGRASDYKCISRLVDNATTKTLDNAKLWHGRWHHNYIVTHWDILVSTCNCV